MPGGEQKHIRMRYIYYNRLFFESHDQIWTCWRSKRPAAGVKREITGHETFVRFRAKKNGIRSRMGRGGGGNGVLSPRGALSRTKKPTTLHCRFSRAAASDADGAHVKGRPWRRRSWGAAGSMIGTKTRLHGEMIRDRWRVAKKESPTRRGFTIGSGAAARSAPISPWGGKDALRTRSKGTRCRDRAGGARRSSWRRRRRSQGQSNAANHIASAAMGERGKTDPGKLDIGQRHWSDIGRKTGVHLTADDDSNQDGRERHQDRPWWNLRGHIGAPGLETISSQHVALGITESAIGDGGP